MEAPLRGPVAALVAAVVGIAASRVVAPSPAGEVLVLTGVFAALALAGGGRARSVAAIVAVALLAGAADLRARHGLVDGPVPAAVVSGERVESPASLTSDPQPGPYSTRAIVSLGGRHVLAVAARPMSSRLAVLEAGDRVTVMGWLDPLTGEERRWRHRHVVGRLDVADLRWIGGPRSPLSRAAGHVRSLLLRGVSRLPQTERGLAAGFLVGDTRNVPDDVEADMRAAGLSHLLAVSGANVAFMLAIAAPLLARFGMRLRFLGGIGVIVVFAAATRFEPSVLRASVMAGLAAGAALAGRPTQGMRLLLLGATGLVLFDPFLVDSVAFRLSFAASAGILLWATPLRRRLGGPRWVTEALATTTAAQLGVAPVLIPTFGAMPLAAIPANVLAAPVAAPLTVAGVMAGAVDLVLGRLVPEVATVAQIPGFALARYVAAVAHGAARLPGSVGPGPVALVATGVGLTMLAASWRRRTLPWNHSSKVAPGGPFPPARSRAS